LFFCKISIHESTLSKSFHFRPQPAFKNLAIGIFISMLNAQFFAVFFGKVINGLAFFTATSIVFLRTFYTLYKKQMAIVVGTVGVCVGRAAALMAAGNYL